MTHNEPHFVYPNGSRLTVSSADEPSKLTSPDHEILEMHLSMLKQSRWRNLRALMLGCIVGAVATILLIALIQFIIMFAS